MIGLPHPGHPVLQLDVAPQPQLRGSSGHGAYIVGLHGSGDENRGGLLGDGVPQIELELASLVAAHGETGAVVPLHEQRGTSQELGEAGQRLQRCGAMGEFDPAEVGEWTHAILPGEGDEGAARSRGRKEREHEAPEEHLVSAPGPGTPRGGPRTRRPAEALGP